MALDRNQFIESFLEEGFENLSGIEAAIVRLKGDPENSADLAGLLRDLHTLKGSARMLKFPSLEKLCHSLETVFKGVNEGRYGIAGATVQLVLAGCGLIRSSLQGIKASKDDTIPIDGLVDACEHAYADEPFSLDWARASVEEGPSQPSTLAPAELNADSVRVRTETIEELVKMHNDLIVHQFQWKRENESLERLETQMRALASQGESVLIEPLTSVATVRKRFAEHFSQIERSSLQVQKGLLNLLMLPVDLILGPLGAMVEQTAASLGKQIRFETKGADLKLDRLILENLRDPVIHLVRNALDHGIEAPDIRQAAGKSEGGAIAVHCSTDSGTFVMKIMDDGKGLDEEKIKAKASLLHPERADEIAKMDPVRLSQFLFEPGFSTKDRADELSGRGVGLDIVKHRVESVKGKIQLHWVPGQGTEFTLSLPLSLATVNGFFVRVRGRKFLLPSPYIQEIILVPEEAKIQLFHRQAYCLRDEIIPLYDLADLLDEKKNAGNGAAVADGHAVVVESFGETMALLVDQVVQHASLISKPLPRSLSPIKALQGFVFDENYDLIPVLAVGELVARLKRSGNFETKKRFSDEAPEYQHILVVDDSFTTREIEKSILEAEHYNVVTAVDGIEALEILKTRSFHLVVTDIHMPRMDGMTLLENLKRDERLQGIPVIVVSSDKDRDKKDWLLQRGADSFLDKSDFNRGHLTLEVRRLLSQSRRPKGGR